MAYAKVWDEGSLSEWKSYYNADNEAALAALDA